MTARVAAAPMKAIVALSLIVTLASVGGWLATGDLTGADTPDADVQALAAVLEVSRHSNALALIGSVETNLNMTRESVIASRTAVAEHKTRLSEQMAILDGGRYAARMERIRDQVGLLVSNVDRIEAGRPDLLRALLAGTRNSQELNMLTVRELQPVLNTSVDNQFYYMMTGRSEFRDATTGDPLTREEFLRYHHLTSLQRSVTVGHLVLAAAYRMPNPPLVTSVEGGFVSAAQRAERDIEYLSAHGGPEMDGSVIPLAERLFQMDAAGSTAFDEIRARLSRTVIEGELIAINHQVQVRLDAEIDGLVEEIKHSAAVSADESEQAASTAQAVLIGIAIVGIIATLVGVRHLKPRSAAGGD
ncbi:MAG: hypothetical protein OXI56_03225 [bacterium]|nr:hypothetical protein [bacterium]